VKGFLNVVTGQLDLIQTWVMEDTTPEEFLSSGYARGAYLEWILVDLDKTPEEEQQA
jgi:hypothetical protein